MADERKIDTIEIDRLYGFLDGLQASGYRIDPGHYIALNDMLMALIARGERLENISFKTLIAPLICSTPYEQQDFYQRFDQWHAALLSAKQANIGEVRATPTKQPQAHKWTFPTVSWKAITSTLVLIALISLLVWSISNLVISRILLYGLMFASIALLSWRLWKFYAEHQYITRELAKQEPVYTKVPVTAYIQEVMPALRFKPIVSSLRKRTQVPSLEVDVENTIETALRHDGWLEIVYRQRKMIPEYIVLIDRKSRLDQQARFVKEIVHRLATDGVWLHQYEFSGDPRICFPLNRKDSPLQLKDLQERHTDSRLLVFIGTGELINPLTGYLQGWLASLSHWRERIILTPDKIHKVLLEELQAYEFAVLPMTLDGLASLVQTFEMGNASLTTNGLRPLPSDLRERPMRWTGRDALPETEVNALIEEIKQYLGENGFYWLCATAVYPELRWELTLYLGNALMGDRKQSLLNLDILLRLSCLPWFRLGYMPDWIRLKLIDQFSDQDEHSVRIAIVSLLATLSGADSFSLSIAQEKNKPLNAHIRIFIDFLKRNTNPTHPVHDYVLLRFVLESRKRRLSIKLLETPRRIIQGIPLSTTSDTIETVKKRRNNLWQNIVGLWTKNWRRGLFSQLFAQSLSQDLSRFWLEFWGRRQPSPQFIFQANEIYSQGEVMNISSLTNALYINLHSTLYAVAISPDGKILNLKGGFNYPLFPGRYTVHYVDKQNRVSVIPKVSEKTMDGSQVTLELVITYRVSDPVKAFEVHHPVDTLFVLIQSDLKEFIRSHTYDEIVGGNDGSMIDNGLVVRYIRDKHASRHQMSKLFFIADIVVRERIGDPKLTEIRENFQVQQRQNIANSELLKQKQELERRIASQEAEIKRIKARSDTEQQDILQKMQLRSIELEQARAELEYRQEKMIRAMNAIAQAFSTPTSPRDPREVEIIRELLDALGDSVPKFQYEMKRRALAAIIKSYESNKHGQLFTSEENEIIKKLFTEIKDSTNIIKNLDQANLPDIELEEIHKRNELPTKALDALVQIYEQVITSKRQLTTDETKIIEKLNSALLEYDKNIETNLDAPEVKSENYALGSPAASEEVERLTNTLLNFLERRS